MTDAPLPTDTEFMTSWIPRQLNDEEQQALREHGKTVVAQVHALQTEHESLGSLRNLDLESRIAALHMAHRSDFRLFPINNLPDAILAHIFSFTGPFGHNPYENYTKRVVILHVCKHWRRVATAEAAFWKAVWFRNPQSFPLCFQMLSYAARGACPVEVRISDNIPIGSATALKGDMVAMRHRQITPVRAGVVHATSKDFLHPEDLAYVQELSAHIQHPLGFQFGQLDIKEVCDNIMSENITFSLLKAFTVTCRNLAAPAQAMGALQLAGMSGHLLRLERLEFRRDWTPGGNDYMPGDIFATVFAKLILGGNRMSALRFLVLDGVHINWKDTKLSNLTTLELRSIHRDHAIPLWNLRTILGNCPRLHRLVIDGTGAGGGLPLDTPPIYLPFLRTLGIAQVPVDDALGIVGAFDAPYLRDLALMRLFKWNYEKLWILLTRRFPDVRVLTLWAIDTHTHQAGYPAYLRFLNSLDKVSILKLSAPSPNAVAGLFYDGFGQNLHPAMRPFIGQWNAPLHDVNRPSSRNIDVPHPHALEMHPPVILPRLDSLQAASNLDWDMLSRFAYFRKLGVRAPLKRLWLCAPTETGEALARRRGEMLKQFEDVRVLPAGAVADDELNIITVFEAELVSRGVQLS